jgi:acetyl esterase
MPLDPFFTERLRVHRRYLIRQRLDAFRRRFAELRKMLLPFLPDSAPGPATSPVAAEGRRASRTATGSAAPDRPTTRAGSTDATAPSVLRRRHRRKALAWDRKELETVGVPGPDVFIAEHVVPVPGFPAVRVRIYYPRPAESGSPAPGTAPVGAWLTFFGGAFRIGGIDYPTTDAANRRRAVDASVAMVAVDYSLAPEFRFPTQVEQAHAALEWLHRNARDLGIDPDRIGVAGMSAGASIAAALTILNRDRQGPPIRLQVLEVPVADLTGRHIDLRATRALGIPSPLAVRELRSVARTYLAHRADARNPLASPLLAASHAGLPEAIIFTAEYDPLRGDGAAYAARLRAAGVEASAVQYLGVIHDVATFTGVLPAARRWHRDVVAALSRLHEQRGATES